MELALGLDLFRGKAVEVPTDLVLEAERLGYHSVWTAEAYGSDAITPLAFLAAQTSRIKLGTAVMQVAARTPTATAMAAATVDALAGGNRFIAGLGVSGPQVVEGWYGQPWGSPYYRLREYVDIMRQVFRREAPVTLDGREYQLPYGGDDALGQGKPLKSILHPNPDLEIFIASGGPANTALTAEVADGWLPMGWSPETCSAYDEPLAKGRAKRDPRLGELQIFPSLTVQVTDDVGSVFDAMRPLTAMYVGGMGSESNNYHREAMARRGFPEEAARIHELWLADRRDEAQAAIPDEYFDAGGLYGSVDRIRARWESRYAGAPAAGYVVRAGNSETLALMADLAGLNDRANNAAEQPASAGEGS